MEVIPSLFLQTYKSFTGGRRLEGTRWQGKLKFSSTSASVGNYRVREEEFSRLPLDAFL